MDLRNLAFKVQFEGSSSTVLEVDKAVDGLKKSVDGTTSNLTDMGKSIKDNTKTDSVDKLGKSTEKLEKSLDSVGKKGVISFKGLKKELESFKKSADKLGRDLTRKLTLPIVGLGTAGAKMALDLDNGIRKVTTLADKDILPVSKIRNEVRAISDASGIAQTEIAESVYSALSAGVESSKVMEFVRSGIDLTRAGFTDMDTAIDATTTVLNAYGDKAYDISKMHDIFVQTQDKGKISVDELGKNIGRVIPTASLLGVNLNQLGASYAILTAKGQNAQLATTNLNSMLDELGKSGSNADKILRQKTGKGFAKLTEDGKNVGEVLGILNEHAKKSGQSLKDMFGSGTAGSAAVALLSEGVEGFNKSLADMDGSTGKTAENAKKMEDGWLKIQKATTQVKNALIDVGAVIAPYIEAGAEKVSMLVERFNDLDEGTKKGIVMLLGLAAATGPLIKGVSGVVGIALKVPKIIGLVGKAFALLTSPVGIVVLKLGLAVQGVKFAIGAFRRGYEETGTIMGGVVNIFKEAVEGIKKLWGGLKEFLKNPIKGTVQLAGKAFDKLTGKTKVDGSHAGGLARVPKDNYLANLHKDEEVLRANDPRNQNNNKKMAFSQREGKSFNISFNPSYNIEIKGSTTEKEANDLVRKIDKQTRKTVQEMFYELSLQMS